MNRSRRNWYVASSLVVVLVSVVDFSGISPWPLAIALFALSTMWFAQQTGYVFAAAFSTVTLLSGLAWWYQVAPHLPGTLWSKTFSIEIVVAIALVYLLGIKVDQLIPSKQQVFYYLPAMALPIFALLAIWTLGDLGKLGYSWAMHNDAVWNIVVSRFVTTDGGVVSSIHQNPSPAIPELLSFASLSGRNAQTSASLFQHDMTRAAEVWLLLALLSSIVAGLIALSIRTIKQTPLRIFTGVTVSSLPLAWFSFGYALEFGFYNATLSLLLLLTVWLIWQKGKRFPYSRIAALGLALTACLAAWGPLAIVPAGLTVLSVIEVLARKIKPISKPELWLAIFSWVIAVSYGLFITFPDLKQQSSALGADGGIFEITPLQAASIVVLSFVAIVLSMWKMKQQFLILGFLVFTLTSLTAIAYLALQRGPNVSRWGYYPVKYSWLLICALLILATAYLLAWISSTKLSNIMKILSAAMAGIGIFLLAWQMPIRLAPTYFSIFPLSNIVSHTGVANEDTFAQRLFSIANSGTPTIAYRSPDFESDQFVNRWLLQLESTSSEDKIRYWAYFMDSTNQDHLCRALLDWGKEVRIVTTENDIGESLKTQCPGARFTIMNSQH